MDLLGAGARASSGFTGRAMGTDAVAGSTAKDHAMAQREVLPCACVHEYVGACMRAVCVCVQAAISALLQLQAQGHRCTKHLPHMHIQCACCSHVHTHAPAPARWCVWR